MRHFPSYIGGATCDLRRLQVTDGPRGSRRWTAPGCDRPPGPTGDLKGRIAMAKTASPGHVDVPNADRFIADALPDPFDARDFEYRPRLQPLPTVLDQRAGPTERYVMYQRGSSCTGHALAAVINAVLARPTDDPTTAPVPFRHVSPYMLYRLARRYDE